LFHLLTPWEFEVQVWLAWLEYHGHNALVWQMILDVQKGWEFWPCSVEKAESGDKNGGTYGICCCCNSCDNFLTRRKHWPDKF